MISVAFYDTKPYDRDYFQPCEDLDWHFHEFRLSAKTASTAAGAAAVCVFVNDKVDRDCLDALRELGVKLIALRCAGFNNVDLAAAKEFGIAVTRVPAYSPYAVAEHTVGLLLALNRKIHRAHNRVREHNFALNGLVGFDVRGKTVGLIGTGMIGRITGSIFKGFGVRLLSYDPFPHAEWAAESGAEYVDLETLLGESDIISLHTPLNRETHHILNDATLSRMKRGVFLVNTSRGKLIDTSALIHHLKTGHVGGVALDVYEEEEGVFFEDLSGSLLQDDELNLLLSFPNVLITAHQAFLTREALTNIAETTAENVRASLSGEYAESNRLA